jgi:hypothetical protein
MSAAEVAIMKEQALIQSSLESQAKLRQAENAVLEREKRDAETERLAEWHREDSRRKHEAEAEATRKLASENFVSDLRRRFFEGNSFASEADFRAMLPELKKRAMLENTASADKSEELMRASGDYSRM